MQVYNDELYHYGKLGMKWGHHKKVEEPINIRNAKELVEKNKTNHNQVYLRSLIGRASQKDLVSSRRELQYANEDLKKVKILEKLKKDGKSNYQLKMETKYKEKGMSDDEAAVAAYNNIRTKKIVAAIGATALTAAIAYVAYKKWDAEVDKIIKSGTSLQNISNQTDKALPNNFYASNNALDKIRYKGSFGTYLQKKGEVINNEIKVLSDIKQVSQKNAKNALSELVKKDKDFADSLSNYMTKNKVKLDPDYSKGIISKDLYEKFNISLVDHSPERQKLTDSYFKTLSEKGYNAIKDVNDVKYSGYNAINPIIAFNTKDKVSINVKELTSKEIKKYNTIIMGSDIASELTKQGSVAVAAIMGGNVITNTINDKANYKKVSNYRESNPNTKLTNTEIIRMLERT